MLRSVALRATPQRTAALSSLLDADATLEPQCLVIVHEPPEVDAFTLLQAQATLEGPLPVVVLTLQPDAALRKRLLRSGATEVGAVDGLSADGLSALVEDAIDRAVARAAIVRGPNSLFSTNLVGILFWDTSGGIQDANDEFLRIVGYDRGDLNAGRVGWAQMTPPEHHAQDQRALAELLATGRHAPIAKEYFRKDGERVWVLVASALLGENGGVGFVLDLSAQKRAEAELRSLNDRLREADRRKDEFIGILAHELRNPLSPVRNAAEILRRIGLGDPRLERARGVIERQVGHMARLVDDLLDVSRIARGNLSLRWERCDLRAIAAQTTEDYRLAFEASGLQLSPPDVGPPLWVDGDPVRLAQMIGNLLHNASRFTARGGEVRVEAHAAGERAEVRVIDTGIGLDRATLARLFDPFAQADQGLARSKGGLGLGLALTRGLAELHRGEVRGWSDGPGTGSTFAVTLPLANSVAPSEIPAAALPGGARALRVLVVEDNRDAAETLEVVLEMLGHHVKVAGDGAAALAAAAGWVPDAVISDIGLPGGLDGYAVARAVRADPRLRHALLIAVSGYCDAAAQQRAQEAGFDVHLAKPADIGVLERVLSERARGA